MPGFASGNDFHEGVLGRHLLSKSAYFMVLNPAERGTIETEILGKIKEIKQNKKDFTFCLSKIEDCFKLDDVKNRILDDLKVYFDYSKDIVALGIDDGEIFKQAILDIDKDKIFKDEFLEGLQIQNNKFKNLLTMKIDVLKTDKELVEQEIFKIKQAIQYISTNTPNFMAKIKDLCDDKVEDMVGIVLEDLISNKDKLMAKIVAGIDVKFDIQKIISDSINSSMKKALNDIQDELVNEFKISYVDLSVENDLTFLNEEVIGNIASDVRANIDKNSNIAGVIGIGLSLLSIILKPILKTFAKFIPIIGMKIAEFFGFKANASKEDMSFEASKILDEAFKNIEDELRKSIPNSFYENIKKLVEQISSMFNDEIKIQINQLEQSLKEKNQSQDEVEVRITILKNQVKALQDLENRYLKG